MENDKNALYSRNVINAQSLWQVSSEILCLFYCRKFPFP